MQQMQSHPTPTIATTSNMYTCSAPYIQESNMTQKQEETSPHKSTAARRPTAATQNTEAISYETYSNEVNDFSITSEPVACANVGTVAVGALHQLQVVVRVHTPLVVDGMRAAYAEVDARAARVRAAFAHVAHV